MSTNLSPTNKYATIAPLFGVLLVTMIKELIEDVQRHKADDKVNSSRAQVLHASAFADVAWADVRVGDIVCVHNKQSVPADLVILSTSDEFGACYVETSGLDGFVRMCEYYFSTRLYSFGLEYLVLKRLCEFAHPKTTIY